MSDKLAKAHRYLARDPYPGWNVEGTPGYTHHHKHMGRLATEADRDRRLARTHEGPVRQTRPDCNPCPKAHYDWSLTTS